MFDLLSGITIGFLGTLTFLLWATSRAAGVAEKKAGPVNTRKPLVPTAEYSPKNAVLRKAIQAGDTDLLRVNLAHVERPEDISVNAFCAHLAVVVADATKLPVQKVRNELEKVYV